jgi:hypothetical protein
MKKQQFWVQASLDLIAEQSLVYPCLLLLDLFIPV